MLGLGCEVVVEVVSCEFMDKKWRFVKILLFIVYLFV